VDRQYYTDDPETGSATPKNGAPAARAVSVYSNAATA
jgi:hypothetical protein